VLESDQNITTDSWPPLWHNVPWKLNMRVMFVKMGFGGQRDRLKPPTKLVRNNTERIFIPFFYALN
jgi:hypothetical protein